MSFATALWRPPLRLRRIPDRAALVLRGAWLVLFGLALLAVVGSTLYAVNASYRVQPTIEAFGLDFDVTSDGDLIVGEAPASGPPRTLTASVAAIDGKRVPPRFTIQELAERLDQAGDRPVAVTLQEADGRTRVVTRTRAAIDPAGVSVGERDMRIWSRLGIGLLACAALLVCSFLLALRRPNDPVAMLLAAAFVGLAATIDPPLQFWLWTDRAVVLDVVGALLFYCLLVGLAGFPDGVFVPRPLRWLIPLGIPVAIAVSLPGVDENWQGIGGMLLLLIVLGSQIVRFRREPAGIVRQQIKWAGFGFGAGFLLVLGAILLAAWLGDDQSAYTPAMALVVLLLFSSGMATVALGLLVALLRYRLWQADTLISRSAAYAVVTLIVGVVWATSSDLLKLVISEVMGRDSEAGATTVGAIIAAAIFAPTQTLVLGWTRRRFGGPLDQIRNAAARLRTWGLTETPAEVATRALAIIDSAVRPKACAILLDGPMAPELIAARNTASADDPQLVERIDLADAESSVGTLLIGRRGDGKRFTSQELAAIDEVIAPLAEALRVARGRFSRESYLEQQIAEMASRLAQLEGGKLSRT